jgi:Tfp pilus assembly protein PilN
MAPFPKIAAPVLPGSRSRLPLLLLGVALAFVLASILAYQQYQEREKANVLLGTAQQDLKSAKAKVAELEAQKTQLEGDKEALETAKAELA